MRRWPMPTAVVGALGFAVVGAVWGAQNEGWFGLERGRGALQAWLGVALAVTLAGFWGGGWGRRLRATAAGTVAAALLVAAPVLHVLSAAIGFAIFGTLCLAAGLFVLAFVAVRNRIVPPVDRVLLTAVAVASITWNTETSSVWLLVAIGVAGAVLAARLLPTAAPRQRATA